MAYNFRRYSPNQILLMPPSLDDWLPQQHLARFISDVVDNLDLKPMFRQYRDNGQGGSSFHPLMMIKVLLYAYCTGVPSSRKIAQALVNDVAFRWLAAGCQPDFRTISTFRCFNLECLRSLFLQVLMVCKRSGMVKAGVVALDGTKVQANAALDRNRTHKKLTEEEEKLVAEIEGLLARAENVDGEEDRHYGDDSGDGLPKVDSAQERLALIRRAKKELAAQAEELAREQERKIAARKEEEELTGKKKRGRKPAAPNNTVEDEAKANLTDPTSRIMKGRSGFVQGYNAQVAASADQVIVACGVTQECNDVQQLKPMIEQTKANMTSIDGNLGVVLADAGYCSKENLEYLAQPDSPEACVAVKKDWKQRTDDDAAPRGRIPKSASLVERMERKLKTKKGKALYRQRGMTVEPVFGQMKSCRGLRRFLLRGLDQVESEFHLWCLTHNLLKLYRYQACVG